MFAVWAVGAQGATGMRAVRSRGGREDREGEPRLVEEPRDKDRDHRRQEGQQHIARHVLPEHPPLWQGHVERQYAPRNAAPVRLTCHLVPMATQIEKGSLEVSETHHIKFGAPRS